KQQIVPFHRHHPGPLRQRPRTMRGFAQHSSPPQSHNAAPISTSLICVIGAYQSHFIIMVSYPKSRQLSALLPGARMSQDLDAFLALLTPEQRALLDALPPEERARLAG